MQSELADGNMLDNVNITSELTTVCDGNSADKQIKHWPSDSKEEKKKRNHKRNEIGRRLRGQIEFCCDKEEEKAELLRKIEFVKQKLGTGKNSNKEMLSEVLNFYIEQNCLIPSDGEREQETQHDEKPYNLLQRGFVDEDIFFSTRSAMKNVFCRIHQHYSFCKCFLDITDTQNFGHSATFVLSCTIGHTLSWTSSPRVEGGDFLVNLRVVHSVLTSGILPNQYNRLCDGANFGKLSETVFDRFSDSYGKIVEKLARESEKHSLQEEIGSGDLTGINILTDARHCWRKNAKFSDVVCIGDITHKVLRLETISKDDDPCTQRHELLGVRRIYQYLDRELCPVNVHCHDSNASVTKFIQTERPPTISTQDTWHATKNISKNIAKICKGSKKLSGLTWHPELADKAASVKTHIYHSIKNCGGNTESLKKGIINLISHYKGDHESCFENSRCRTDENYIPSKDRIVSPSAEGLLLKSLQNLPVYKKPCEYVHCKDTHYVESFNNCLLQYHDKRIVFGENTYRLRINLSILDWNENVDRRCTSVSFVESATCVRRSSGHKVLVRKTFSFREEIFRKWMDFIYA